MHAINGNAEVFLEFLLPSLFFRTVVQNSLAEICTTLTCIMSAKCAVFNDNDVSESYFFFGGGGVFIHNVRFVD